MERPGNVQVKNWAYRSEAVVIALILVGAAVVRLWNLDGLPDGLHGDEAWTGLDARRILHEGWIGPYVPSALGQPTGLLYFVAGLFLWLPDDIGTIRLAIAITGTLGIVFTYLAAREYEGPVFAAFAAALLAGIFWHLHGSRMGMMFVSFPTFLMAGLWAQAVALRRRSFVRCVAAGLVAGLGVYGYNAYPTALPLYAIPFAHAWAIASPRSERYRVFQRAAGFAAGALIALVPMITYAIRDPEFFFRHHQQVSVFSNANWIGGDWSTRATMLATRARYWFEGVFFQGRFDSGDAFGAAEIPLVDPITACLAAGGVVAAMIRWRRPLSALMLAALPVIGLGALLTFGPGAFRRTIGLAPFVAMLAAAALHEVYRLASRWSERSGFAAPRALALATGIALVAGAAWIDLRAYFGPFNQHPQVRWVFARELRYASEFLVGVPRGTRVYFFSERWSCNYETRRYLAPEVDCVDRSQRFGQLKSRSGLIDYSAPQGQPALLLLLGDYLKQYDDLVRRHPDAVHETKEIDGKIVFAAIHLPAGTRPKFEEPIREVDTGGAVVSLTQLEPLDIRYDFAPPMVNQTWNGQPLRLGELRFSRGLGMHAPTEVVYGVPARVTRFVSSVALSPQTDDCAKASVVFEVVAADGTLLASSGIMRAGDPPQVLKADLSGVREVTLIAGDAGDGRDCDHANWGNPRFLRTPLEPVGRTPHAAAARRPNRQAP